MTKHTADYIEGWKAARAQYQATGGVQPYPPGFIQRDVVAEHVTLGIQDSVHTTKLRDEQIPKKPQRARKKASGA